jgi:UDP-N-acetylglucosamine acyltransferase
MANYIHPTAIVHDNVILGDNNWIGPYCIIGGPPEYPNRDPREKHGWVHIGDGNIFHGHVTVDAGTDEDDSTNIGDDNTFMKGSHVGHDVVMVSNNTISCGVKIGGHSVITKHCTLGLNSTMHQFSVLGIGTMLGASSFFKGKTERDFTTWAGVPAKYIKDNEFLMKKLGLI